MLLRQSVIYLLMFSLTNVVILFGVNMMKVRVSRNQMHYSVMLRGLSNINLKVINLKHLIVRRIQKLHSKGLMKK